MSQHEERLRRLAIHDGSYIERILCPGGANAASISLDGRARSLVRVGVLVAIDAPDATFDAEVASALANGATADDVVDVLIATCSLVGSAHIASTAPRVARALGYDLDAALEGHGEGMALGRG
jgi:alkylhydroperoxidase/carboxymuconolactone decarboxylase family protein YurZ